MGTIAFSLVDIGSAVAGYLFGEAAPKIFGGGAKTSACEGHDKSALTTLVARIKKNVAAIEAAMAA